MIVGDLNNIEEKLKANKYMIKAIEFLSDKQKLAELPVGKTEIDENNVFALIQEYPLKEFNESMWEAHKKYYDIHFIIRGTEDIAVKNITAMKNVTEYNEAGDYWLFKGDIDKVITLNKEQFVLFYPEDVHQPGLMNSETKSNNALKKVVVKVLI